jgi:Domain of unknown function (DUF4062)
LREERLAVREAVEKFPFLEAWAFEHAPASTQELDESYLGNVDTCDLFVLILGERTTHPVIAECLRAKRHGKPTLVFLKSLPGRRPEVDDLLADLNKKDATFSGINELKSAVRDTLHSTCVGGIRKLSEKRLDPIIHSESAGYLLNRPPDTRQLLMFLVFDMTIENQGVAATVLKDFGP